MLPEPCPWHKLQGCEMKHLCRPQRTSMSNVVKSSVPVIKAQGLSCWFPYNLPPPSIQSCLYRTFPTMIGWLPTVFWMIQGAFGKLGIILNMDKASVGSPYRNLQQRDHHTKAYISANYDIGTLYILGEPLGESPWQDWKIKRGVWAEVSTHLCITWSKGVQSVTWSCPIGGEDLAHLESERGVSVEKVTANASRGDPGIVNRTTTENDALLYLIMAEA